MSGMGEAAADIAQGALLARAIEPVAGEAGDGHTAEIACLNCGTALVGPCCHACGQPAHVHRTIGAFLHDLLHGVFHFEGKIWRTLPMLAWQPGKLTREYIDGRRASYVSPIALFLFSVFLLFAVASNFAGSVADMGNVDVNGRSISGLEANEQELARLQAERARLLAAHQPTDKIDGEIAGREEGVKVLRQLKVDAGQAIASIPDNQATSGVAAIDDAFRNARANPQLALYKLQTHSYKYSWALIPLSVPFVWLLFAFRRRFGLYDHTVFVTYSLSFMSFMASAVLLARAAHLPRMGSLFGIVAPLHMFRQLRGTYDLGVGAALWRTAALVLVALLTLTAFALLLLYEAAA